MKGIRKRSDGRWEGRYTLGMGIDGKQKRKAVYARTEKDVRAKLANITEKILAGEYIENENIRLGAWLKEWLEVSKKNTVKASTFECYNMYIRKHIYMDDIGYVKLTKLKPLHFKQFYTEKLKVLAPASVVKLHNILKSALNEAVDNEYVKKNPLLGVETPNAQKREIEILTIHEQETFIKNLDGETLQPFFLLALQTGLRIGEIIALKWDCVDLDKNIITVKATSKRVITEFDKNYDGIKSKVVLQSPKTNRSYRTVPLMSSASEMLRNLKDKRNDNDIVFRTSTQSMYEAKNINRTLKRILEKAKIKHMTFHSLRHTFVSIMLENNVDIKTISEIVGHTKTSFTLDTYAHLLPNKKHDAVEKIGHYFDK